MSKDEPKGTTNKRRDTKIPAFYIFGLIFTPLIYFIYGIT